MANSNYSNFTTGVAVLNPSDIEGTAYFTADEDGVTTAQVNLSGSIIPSSGTNVGLGQVNEPAQITEAGADVITAGTSNQVQRYDFGAGAGTYTFNIDLSETATEGQTFYIYISKAASSNPTIVVRDGVAGSSIISINNANAENYGCIFVFDGTNWQKHIVCLNDL